MAIDEAMLARIESECEKVTADRPPYPNFSGFSDRYTHVLAQFEMDKEPIMKAGFNWDEYLYYTAVFSKLNLVHADRVAAEGKGYTQSAEFREEINKIKNYRTILSMRLKFLLKLNKSEAAEVALKEVTKGHTQVDIVRDVLSLVSVLREFLHVTGGLKPSGVEVNETYLNDVQAEAEPLIAEEGEMAISESPRAVLVKKQNRLITLCMNAFDEMRFYAKGAFALNPEYYREHYRFSSTKTASDEDETDSDVDESAGIGID